jgi:hypothetical protein
MRGAISGGNSNGLSGTAGNASPLCATRGTGGSRLGRAARRVVEAARVVEAGVYVVDTGKYLEPGESTAGRAAASARANWPIARAFDSGAVDNRCAIAPATTRLPPKRAARRSRRRMVNDDSRRIMASRLGIGMGEDPNLGVLGVDTFSIRTPPIKLPSKVDPVRASLQRGDNKISPIVIAANFRMTASAAAARPIVTRRTGRRRGCDPNAT